MNRMKVFQNEEFGTIRVIEENDRHLFCAKTV